MKLLLLKYLGFLLQQYGFKIRAAMILFFNLSHTSSRDISQISFSSTTYTVESRYNAVVGVQEMGPRYKWIAL